MKKSRSKKQPAKTKSSSSSLLCSLTCKKNFTRDIFIIFLTIFTVITLLLLDHARSKNFQVQQAKEKKLADIRSQQAFLEKFEKENITKISSLQEKIRTEEWKNYQSNWYGFKIKYPQNWSTPLVNQDQVDSQADYHLSFLKDRTNNQNLLGFDVAVYDINKIQELTNSDEFPKIKDAKQEMINQCASSQSFLLETGDYPAEEIYVPLKNDCYDPTLFFSITKGQYIYNISPILKENYLFRADPLIVISDELPEFFVAASEFENIEIIRPSPLELLRQRTPKPVSYKIDSLGRLVCAKKHDKPGKSKQDKEHHLDMECCLDPDEDPNPHCYYPLDKYGKFLK